MDWQRRERKFIHTWKPLILEFNRVSTLQLRTLIRQAKKHMRKGPLKRTPKLVMLTRMQHICIAQRVIPKLRTTTWHNEIFMQPAADG